MAIKVELDRSGIRELLKSPEIRGAVEDMADRIADQVSGSIDPDAEVVVDTYTTDRAAASVTIKHPAAQLWQARDGVLTRAAAAVGLEVKSR